MRDVIKKVPNPAKPLICIYAAPTSLCIFHIPVRDQCDCF